MARSNMRIFVKLLIVAILAGWICVWALKPTKVWKKSWHLAEDAARETFLGVAGINVVLFCYPVLSVAVLGYAYMHLLSTENTVSRKQKSTFVMKKLANPVIVHSPFGILSRGELLAGALFTALLIWTFYSNISSDFYKLLPPKSLNLDRQQLKILRVGIRFGSLAEICLAVLLLPILRGMALFKIFGLQFETSVRYHVWVGNVMILVASIHGITIMSIWAAKKCFWTEITKWQATGRVNLAGAITLISGVAIWITSLPPVRRYNFQLFFSSHHLYISFLAFFLFHGGDRHFYLVFSGVLLLALDKILRTIQSKPTACLMSARLLPCRAVQLTLAKHPSLRYTATSMMFIKVPSISRFHWHPFSITSSAAANSETMSITIKCQGWWTSTLYDNLQSLLTSGDGHRKSFLVAMEGPYGPSTNLFLSYDSLVLIAGGSGVTPMLSILEEIASSKNNTTRHLQRIQLIYAVKKAQDLSMLMPISHLLQQSPSPLHFKLQAFVTQEKQLHATTLTETLQQEFSQAEIIHFDPKTPIQAPPRPDMLLWRASVTALASIVFLVMLAGLSRAFLPTGKKAAEMKNPSWINNLLVIIAFAVAMSCSAFGTIIWRRRRKTDALVMSKEHVKYKEAQLEEFAGVVEEHELYAGQRPDVQGLLTEISMQWKKSEKVGIFVCGPDTMQESAASFCRKSSNAKVDFHPLNFCL